MTWPPVTHQDVQDAITTLQGASLIRVKTADETLTATVSLQDDDHLFFSIGANETWLVEINAWATVSSGLNAGPKLLMLGPAGSTIVWGTDAKYYSAPASDLAGTGYNDQATTLSMYADNLFRAVRLHAYVANGSTAGTVKLQWAQFSSSASNTTMKAGSYLTATRVS